MRNASVFVKIYFENFLNDKCYQCSKQAVFESLLSNGFIKNRITDNENESYMENHYCL